MWKFYNNFDPPTHNNMKKELLKDEINNIALQIVKNRENKSTMMFNPQQAKFEPNWKAPEPEPMGRRYDEGARFFSINPRMHGVKHVPAPVAENLYELNRDLKLIDVMQAVNHVDYEIHPLFRKDRA